MKSCWARNVRRWGPWWATLAWSLAATTIALGAPDWTEPHLRRAALVEALARATPPTETVAAGEARSFVAGEPWAGQAADGTPLLRLAHNASAARTSAIDRVLGNGLFGPVDGSGVEIGLWDAGLPRTTHRELVGRIVLREAGSTDSHTTHTTATILASGVDSLARGMAPAATLRAFNWTTDTLELAAEGAALPGDAGRITLGNLSYGFIRGWNRLQGANVEWTFHRLRSGGPQPLSDPEFGRYNAQAATADTIAWTLPYFLMVRSGGNDRTDNPPTGALVFLNLEDRSANRATNYDATNPAHPPGDAVWRGGHDLVADEALAKNTLTVNGSGAAPRDATGALQRVPALGAYLCFGPTDDGRIKPDLLAQGDNVYSATGTGDAAYATSSGSSYAAPVVTGALALVQQRWGQLWPGAVARAAGRKGLLLHTADDLDTPGPDSRTGWGLLHAERALQAMAAARAGEIALYFEDRLPAHRPAIARSLIATGGPVRVTVVWTDPPGAERTTEDDPRPALVHDVDTIVEGPGGLRWLPWVLPRALDTAADRAAPAVQATNPVDTVEQVTTTTAIAPGTALTLRLSARQLGEGEQPVAVWIEGARWAPLAEAGPRWAAQVTETTAEIRGRGFGHGLAVGLAAPGGQTPTHFGAGVEVFPGAVRFRPPADLAVPAAGGAWAVWVRAVGATDWTPVPGGLTWQEPAETDLLNEPADDLAITAGWSTYDQRNNSYRWQSVASPAASGRAWLVTTTSPLNGDQAISDVNLESPAVSVPANVGGVALTFQHALVFNFAPPAGVWDGGVLEVSLDGGAWQDVTTVGTFEANGYAYTADNRYGNPLGGRRVWSASSNGAFLTVRLAFDPALVAGRSLRLRWRLGTDQFVGSTWTVDNIRFAWRPPLPVTYAQWAARELPDNLPPADYAATSTAATGNGWPNLLEMALGGGSGLAPRAPRWTALPGAPGELTIERPTGLAGVAYAVETAPGPAGPWTVAPDWTATVVGPGRARDREQVRWQSPSAANLPPFVRLKVTISAGNVPAL